MGDTITITDANGIVRIVGVMSDPGATPTHVLTIDADEEVSAQAGGGGGSAFLITVLFDANGSDGFSVVPNTLIGGAMFTGDAACAVITDAPRVIAMGAFIVVGASIVLSSKGVVPSTPDALDLQIVGFVTDQTGTNTASIIVNGSVASPVTDTAKTIDLASGTWTILSGADLTDNGSGNLKTTAGGVFTTTFACQVTWD